MKKPVWSCETRPRAPVPPSKCSCVTCTCNSIKTTYKTIQSPQDAIELQQHLLAMQSWEDTWLMKFNISKCFVMRVTQSRKHKVLYDYQLHNSILSSVDHCNYKYLGVVLQSNLQWSKHIEEVIAKANFTLGMIH